MRFILFSALFIVCFKIPVAIAQTDTISILSWNIYMRPRLVMHDNQVARAKEIVETLKKDSIDIIVFQELFDRKARKIIRNGLKERYPNITKRAKKKAFRLSTGVMIFSKYPIKNSQVAFFDTCKSHDCLSTKGAIFAEIIISENKKLHLFGTHLQSVSGNIFSKIRKGQLFAIKNLYEKNKSEDVPAIYLGDFNIELNDSMYQYMTNLFAATTKHISSKRKNSIDTENSYRSGQSNSALIDHILLNQQNSSTQIESIEIKKFEFYHKGKTKDLSDHYAVKAKIIY